MFFDMDDVKTCSQGHKSSKKLILICFFNILNLLTFVVKFWSISGVTESILKGPNHTAFVAKPSFLTSKLS